MSNILLILITYFIFDKKHVDNSFNIWVISFLILAIIRIFFIFYHKNQVQLPGDKNISKRLFIYRFGVFLSSFFWGIGVILFFPQDDLYSIFYLTFIIMGVTTGALLVHTIDYTSSMMYPIFIIFPFDFMIALYIEPSTIPILLGTTLYFVFIIMNIKRICHDRKNLLISNFDLIEKEKEKSTNEEQYKLLLHHSPIGIIHYEKNLDINYYNNQFANIIGVNSSDKRLQNLKDLKDEKLIQFIKESFEGNISEFNGTYSTLSTHRKLWLRVLSSPIKDLCNETIGGVCTIEDMTQQKDSEEKIKKLVSYDTLTHLPNRQMFTEKLNQSLLFCKQSKNYGVLMLLDLDHFKSINDTLGHEYGDMLLIQVAKRLQDIISKLGLVARFGGDEFTILLNDTNTSTIHARKIAKIISKNILLSLNKPFLLLGNEYQTSPSIGIVIFNEKNQNTDELLKYADIAMYQAKKSGRNSIKFFDYAMHSEVAQRVSLETQLQDAIKNNEFTLHYQPQIDDTKFLYGVEALIRWNHPQRGLVYPNDFIAVAEDTGLIIDIGYEVLKTAFKQLVAWQDNPLMKNIIISVNVSAIQIRQDDFASIILNLVDEYKVKTSQIKLEITEGTLLEYSEEIIETMKIIRNKGIKFSLDDFGVGYSSLNYLKKLPIDELKIDQSFIRDITCDLSDYDIVKTIIAIAKSFRFNLIAEGVEDVDQYQLLKNIDCKRFQGYFFSKPLPTSELEKIVTANDGYIDSCKILNA